MSDTPTLPPPPSTSLTLIPFPAPAAPAKVAKAGKAAIEKDESRRTSVRKGAITKKDRDRWRRWKDGQSEDEIAAVDHTSQLVVRKSIQRVLSYHSSVSHEAVDMAANELAIGTIQKLGTLIDDVLAAEKDKTVTDAEGKETVIAIPDLKMRLSVFDKITKLVQSVRKGDGLSINMNNNQTNVVVAGAGRGRSVEERIRALREKNHLKNEEDARVEDAEFEDIDEDDEDDDAADEGETRGEEEEEEDGE